MRVSRALKRAGAACCLAVVVLNVAAYRHARAFTTFAPPGRRTPPPDRLSAVQKAQVLLTGIQVPRPAIRRTPADVGLPYERHVFAGVRNVALEAWLIPRSDARGTVVLFHGHAAAKDSQLREAAAFHRMGLNALLVDFHGSGGSGGNETSIGFHEAVDVAKAADYARGLPGARPVVVYGASMGAAAILKAAGDVDLPVAGLILECPFDSLITTVRHRFAAMGVPAFPAADLLVFWGGVHAGFDGLRYRPVDSAARIHQPTLLISGENDPWVRPAEARAIYDNLQGPKVLELLPGVGHESCLRRRPDAWKDAVGAFLDDVIGSGRSHTVAASE